MPFDYTSGNPDNLTGGAAARMQDIQGPFYDIRAWLNSSTGGGGGAGGYTPAGSALMPVLDVGQQGQIRAGHQLAPGDFTAMGLSVPVAIWNLGDLTDVSGNGRALTNKGAVPFGVGINGFSTSAAVFAGSTGQALFIADTGVNDPFRIRTGSWGCWFRTAKRGTVQSLLGRWTDASNIRAWALTTVAANTCRAVISFDGTYAVGTTTIDINGVSDICDDRWHFGLATFDGTALRLYVDGVLEAVGALSGTIAVTSVPTNIGAYAADGSTAASAPSYGRIDEAFVSGDVLTDDQIRNLYCAKVAHLLAAVPTRVKLAVTRRRRGAALVVGDFPASPVRLHNFTAGALTDQGTGGIALVAQVNTPVTVSGADGSTNNGLSFNGVANLAATDAGLPAGTASRSHGCWLKTTTTSGAISVLGWGTLSTGEVLLRVVNGALISYSNSDATTSVFIADGQWHHVIASEDNAAGDGVRRKLYVDGRLVAGSTVLNGITLSGANGFRVGARVGGSEAFNGQIDTAFVYAGALTAEQVWTLYQKAGQALGASPKNPGDHVESMDNSNVLAVFDSLESQHQVDLGVAA